MVGVAFILALSDAELLREAQIGAVRARLVPASTRTVSFTRSGLGRPKGPSRGEKRGLRSGWKSTHCTAAPTEQMMMVM